MTALAVMKNPPNQGAIPRFFNSKMDAWCEELVESETSVSDDALPAVTL
jgi:hypothetical protein